MGKMSEVANEKEAARARKQRERNVREATASVALEGFTVSADHDADSAAYIRGEITVDEVTKRALARHVRCAA